MKIPPFTEKLWILLIPYLSFILAGATKYFSPKRRAEEMKASSHFRFCLGKCAGEFELMGQEFPQVFLGLQKFAKYYMCISHLFHLITLTLQKMDESFGRITERKS